MVDVTSIDTLEVKRTKPSLWTRFSKRFERIGYLRAAKQLSAMGYHEEAQRCLSFVK